VWEVVGGQEQRVVPCFYIPLNTATPPIPPLPPSPPTPTTLSFIYLFKSLGYFQAYTTATLLPIVVIVCLLCTLIESLPLNQILDNNFRWVGVTGWASAWV